MASKFQFITELYNTTLLRVTGDHERWTGFLRAACYNYKCPFDEQILICAQCPTATAVLELDKWNRQFGRWVNKGASGIAVFHDTQGKGRLKYYFDVADTHETLRSRPVPIWEMDAAFSDRVIETLENTFGDLSEKETLPDAVLSAAHNAVADNLPDYLRDLKDYEVKLHLNFLGNQDPAVQKRWNEIPHDGEVPTPEELLIYLSSCVKPD